MKKVDIKKLAAAGTLSVGLVFGMAGFAGATSGTIDTTGPDSNNQIRHNSRVNLEVENDNDVDLSNRTDQRATTGDTRVRGNTTGGDAMSGSAMNDNAVDAWVEIDNSGAAADLGSAVADLGMGDNEASIENTGPDSNNQVNFRSRVNVEVENDNDIDIDNTTTQSATSGDATVRHNTTGGDAVSGDASNTSSSVFTVSVSN